MRISSVIYERRKELGLTQSELAQLSNVSVPFIQLIESGKGNPSLDVASALLGAVGSSLQVKDDEPLWDDLTEMGVPIGHPSHLVWRELKSAALLKSALRFVHKHNGYTRERDALEAFLVALKLHYPSRFRSLFKNWRPKLPNDFTGRQIKLKRIALSNLAKLM